ncbi:MAG: hypothetical protein FWE63_01930 [Bacteroidales bacterium]|nr:hypothetical protein [Bacteroidales bacterium]
MKATINNNFRKIFDFVVFAICIILICVLSTGCKSKQIVLGTTSQSHTNTTTTTVLKDTVIDVRFVATPPVFVHVPIRDTVASDTVFAENSTAKALAFIQNGKLNLELFAKDTVIPIRLPNAIRETTTNQTTNSEKTTVVQEKSKKHFFGTLIERVLILLGLILLIILGISITTKRIV